LAEDIDADGTQHATNAEDSGGHISEDLMDLDDDIYNA